MTVPVTLFLMSYQVNCVFPIQDVYHVISNRLVDSRVNRIGFGDSSGYDAMAKVSAKQPLYAFSCMESNRMHFFLHDGLSFRLCLWDGRVSFDDKISIVKSMTQWLQRETGGIYLEHLVFDYEDGVVFTDVFKEIEKDVREGP
jgi:hypothetical protein